MTNNQSSSIQQSFGLEVFRSLVIDLFDSILETEALTDELLGSDGQLGLGREIPQTGYFNRKSREIQRQYSIYKMENLKYEVLRPVAYSVET